MKDEQAKAYLDPAKAEEERQKGNDMFTKGDYPGAVKAYSEAIKRNPEDAKIFSNRAAAYRYFSENLVEIDEYKIVVGPIEYCLCFSYRVLPNPGCLHYFSKLMEFNLALKDCDKCIELDPNFIKGHIRKGHICIALKNFQKAIEAFEKAQSLDSGNQEAVEGYRQVSFANLL